MTAVQPVLCLGFLETRWLYTGVLAFTFSFPLIFGFLPQLKFYKKWPRFFAANLAVSAVFIAWDVYFTQLGVWGFSEKYTIGCQMLGLPVEEWLFFVCVPAACVFIYESLNHFLKSEPLVARFSKNLTRVLALLCFMVGIIFWEHLYTATTFLGCGFILFYQLYFVKHSFPGRFYLAYLLSCLPFLLVNGVLTGMFTQSPVVLYNSEEYLGFRVGTVPGDDFAYSFLMLFANVALYESKVLSGNFRSSTN
ncbi:MAG: lycopene cyclase domain-containing protein [Saprospiraceae bacterium]